MKKIPVLFITYNRIDYTKRALTALLRTKYPIEIFIWDNGSDNAMRYVLNDFLKENSTMWGGKIAEVIFCKENFGINKAFNEFIKRYSGQEFLAKVDNDTIVDEDWLRKLVMVMYSKKELDVLGAFMQRPPGQWNFQTWVDSVMKKEYVRFPKVYSSLEEGVETDLDNDPRPIEYDEQYIAYNSYTGGTGVLMRTRIFWEHGLLFDKYPCKLGDFTTFQRLIFKGNNIGWFSGTTVKLLNIKEDGVSLSNDYPEYDEELGKERDEGNKWYSNIGGAPGVEKFIQENGGRERL